MQSWVWQLIVFGPIILGLFVYMSWATRGAPPSDFQVKRRKAQAVDEATKKYQIDVPEKTFQYGLTKEMEYIKERLQHAGTYEHIKIWETGTPSQEDLANLDYPVVYLICKGSDISKKKSDVYKIGFAGSPQRLKHWDRQGWNQLIHISCNSEDPLGSRRWGTRKEKMLAVEEYLLELSLNWKQLGPHPEYADMDGGSETFKHENRKLNTKFSLQEFVGDCVIGLVKKSFPAPR